MSAKYYCDVCGREMKKSDHGRLMVKLGPVSVEVMTSFRKVWNDGNICHACVKRVVAKGKS